MPLNNGSGSRSCYFRHWPSRCQKKIFNTFFCLFLLKIHLRHKKSKRKSQNSRNQGFSYYFCLLMEGSGSIPLTNGSGFGSGRLKNMWIRIRNTAFTDKFCHVIRTQISPTAAHFFNQPLLSDFSVKQSASWQHCLKEGKHGWDFTRKPALSRTTGTMARTQLRMRLWEEGRG